MPKFDPTGAMGVGGMAARAGAKVAAPILKEAAEVAEQMTIRTYRLAKSYLAGAKPATEMEALNEVAKLEPGLLKASIEDIKNYFKAVVKAYEDSIGN
jgi:ferritin-like protein